MNNKTFLKNFFLFLLLNFTALAIGGLFTRNGVVSEWYLNLDKAPWTPPGWVFGAAWTIIMICFSFYMAILLEKLESKPLLVILFAIQWLFNVIWNPIFFELKWVGLGMLVISFLTILVFHIFTRYKSRMLTYRYLLLPYMIWLIIATSLNAYILIAN